MHHGMLTVYKEAGYTSSDAVARLRGILRMRKIGHTGTLDPDAVGVLPMCLGNATRICELIADREKEYVAVMRLGVQTDTQDMSGEILREIPEEDIPAILLHNGCLQEAEEEKIIKIEKIQSRIREAAAAFVGEIDQIPPMYSAVKVNGKRLYDMARKGITVERKPRRITIYALDIEKVELPLVTMRIRCSKGTYIRTLCEDLGNALGTGAAMQSLIRTRVGQFTLDQARTLDELEHLAKTKPEELLPPAGGQLFCRYSGSGLHTGRPAPAQERQCTDPSAAAFPFRGRRPAERIQDCGYIRYIIPARDRSG